MRARRPKFGWLLVTTLVTIPAIARADLGGAVIEALEEDAPLPLGDDTADMRPADMLRQAEAAELERLAHAVARARSRHQHADARLRTAVADRMATRGIALDWRRHTLAELHDIERRWREAVLLRRLGTRVDWRKLALAELRGLRLRAERLGPSWQNDPSRLAVYDDGDGVIAPTWRSAPARAGFSSGRMIDPDGVLPPTWRRPPQRRLAMAEADPDEVMPMSMARSPSTTTAGAEGMMDPDAPLVPAW